MEQLNLYNEEGSREIFISDSVNDLMSNYIIGRITEINKIDELIKDKKTYIVDLEEVKVCDEEGNALFHEDGTPEVDLIEVKVWGDNYKPEPIRLHINSGGGYDSSMMSIIDYIENSVTPVEIIVSGECMSATTLILAVGHKRKAHKRTRFMIHGVSYGVRNQKISKHKQQLEEANWADGIVRDIYEKYTNIPKEIIDRIITEDEDVYFDTNQALIYGLIDCIV